MYVNVFSDYARAKSRPKNELQNLAQAEINIFLHSLYAGFIHKMD